MILPQSSLIPRLFCEAANGPLHRPERYFRMSRDPPKTPRRRLPSQISCRHIRSKGFWVKVAFLSGRNLLLMLRM